MIWMHILPNTLFNGDSNFTLKTIRCATQKLAVAWQEKRLQSLLEFVCYCSVAPVPHTHTEFNLTRAPLSIMRSGGSNIVNDFSNCCANLLFYYYYFFVRCPVELTGFFFSSFFRACMFIINFTTCRPLTSSRSCYHYELCFDYLFDESSFQSTQFSRCSLLWEFFFCSSFSSFTFLTVYTFVYPQGYCLSSTFCISRAILFFKKGALVYIRLFFARKHSMNQVKENLAQFTGQRLEFRLISIKLTIEQYSNCFFTHFFQPLL